MNGPYTFQPFDDDSYEIRSSSGKALDRNFESQDFLDALTWASNHEPTLFPGHKLERGYHFFCAAQPLIDHLKNSGIIMHTCRPAPNQKYRIMMKGRSFHVNQESPQMFNMTQSVEIKEDSEYEGLLSAGMTERSGLTGRPSRIYLTAKLVDELDRRLQSDKDDVRRVSSWPIERYFVYLDISDFSRQPPGRQVLILNSIVEILKDQSYWNESLWGILRSAPDRIEAKLCIGDGYIFVFDDPFLTISFAAAFAYLIEALVANQLVPVSYHFRMSAHVGLVYTFWDPGRSGWNYINDPQEG